MQNSLMYITDNGEKKQKIGNAFLLFFTMNMVVHSFSLQKP